MSQLRGPRAARALLGLALTILAASIAARTHLASTGEQFLIEVTNRTHTPPTGSRAGARDVVTPALTAPEVQGPPPARLKGLEAASRHASDFIRSMQGWIPQLNVSAETSLSLAWPASVPAAANQTTPAWPTGAPAATSQTTPGQTSAGDPVLAAGAAVANVTAVETAVTPGLVSSSVLPGVGGAGATAGSAAASEAAIAAVDVAAMLAAARKSEPAWAKDASFMATFGKTMNRQPGASLLKAAPGETLTLGRRRGYSQHGEDAMAYERYFWELVNGTFLEMGALDGILITNTYRYERRLGWKGVLIEASKANFDKIPANRPDALDLNVAVCGEPQMVHVAEADGLGGIYEFMSDGFRQRWKAVHEKGGDPMKLPAVPCLPLMVMLEAYGIKHINFYSLDVEGAEYEVVKSIDFSKVTFDVVCVEADGTNKEKDEGVAAIFEKNGYVREHKASNARRWDRNDWFVRKDFVRSSKAAAVDAAANQTAAVHAGVAGAPGAVAGGVTAGAGAVSVATSGAAVGSAGTDVAAMLVAARKWEPAWVKDASFMATFGKTLQREAGVSLLKAAPGEVWMGKRMGLSQFGEDLKAYENFFWELVNGTFLEMGALDGMLISNTYRYERRLGWRGVLIEASKANFDKMPGHRPNALDLNVAVCGEPQMVHVAEAQGVGGIYEFMSDGFRQRWKAAHEKGGDPMKLPAVPCLPLMVMLEAYGIKHINFYSLDVEGAEYEVVKSIDFSKVTFDVVCVEADGSNKDKDEAVAAIFEKNGYVREIKSGVGRLNLNDWFVRKDFVRSSKAAALAAATATGANQTTAVQAGAAGASGVLAGGVSAGAGVPAVSVAASEAAVAAPAESVPASGAVMDPLNAVEMLGSARKSEPAWANDTSFMATFGKTLHREVGASLLRPAVGENVNLGKRRGYSQFGEDVMAFERYFWELVNGTFLEMGALDGLLLTNTYRYERRLGWKGVLIEASKANFDQIPANRPEALDLNVAVCGEPQMVHVAEAQGVGGIYEFMSPAFREQWKTSHLRGGDPMKLPAVPCLPLMVMLEAYGIKHINFYSLDVEGAEYEVVKSIDFSKVTFDVIVVEADGTNVEKDEGVAAIFEKNGYVREVKAGNGKKWDRNDWFVRKDFVRSSKAAAALAATNQTAVR